MMSCDYHYVNKYSEEKSGWKFTMCLNWYVRVVGLWTITFSALINFFQKLFDFFTPVLFCKSVYSQVPFFLNFQKLEQSI